MDRGPRRIGLVAAAILAVVYAATLAPDVTFWDAGEFIAAARTLGIPHPPGTPLFVLLLAVWARAFGFLRYAVATNLMSAACTAAAGGLAASLVSRISGSRWAGLAAALAAGGMSTAWSNATETEVYAASLLLAMLALWVAERAGRLEEPRWQLLVAYLLALAVPLHLSALLAAPAVIWLAAVTQGGSIRWDVVLRLSGVTLLSAGVARASPVIAAIGVVLILVRRPALGAATLGVAVVAISPVLFLLLRAAHDPAINQGNPATWHALADVIARKQYAVAPLWPRGAPVWLQVGNLFEYADWQVALSLAPTVIPTPWRIVATVLFVWLAVEGVVAHWSADRRTCWGMIALVAAASLGAAAYLNLRLGPSFGWGVVPDDVLREARERDYFFVLAFWGWGMWAGWGAVRLVSQRRWPAVAGVCVAALPIALNWGAVSRRRSLEAELPRAFATRLLESAPPNAVLFLAGDNDTYPVWAIQAVHRFRPDVTPVTLPLLGAGWYQRELSRRWALPVSDAVPVPPSAAARAIAVAAQAAGRPVAVSLGVPARERNRLSEHWAVHGLVYLARTSGDTGAIAIDSAATAAAARSIAVWRHGRTPRPSIDGVSRMTIDLMACPAMYLSAASSIGDSIAVASLDSTCNLR